MESTMRLWVKLPVTYIYIILKSWLQALTAADIGVAIGSGSDVAISSASFILVSSNLKSLVTLCDLARTVFRRVTFNFVRLFLSKTRLYKLKLRFFYERPFQLYAAMYNIVALPIAAGVIYPAGHARLAPVWASLAMALSSVTVVCSSLLLKFYREPRLWSSSIKPNSLV